MNPTLKRWFAVGGGVLGTLLLSFLILRFIDLFLSLSLYSWFFARVQSLSGFTDEITGAIAIWLTAAVVLLAPAVVASLLWDKRKAVLIIALCVSGWFVLSFLFTEPRDGYYFNPMTGAPRYKYTRKPDGKIELLPMGYRYDPHYGTKLESITPEIFKEYEQQQNPAPVVTNTPVQPAVTVLKEQWATITTNPQWTPAHHFSDHEFPDSSYNDLEMAIEAFGIRGDEALVRVGVRMRPKKGDRWLLPPNETYFIDSKGTRFECVRSVPDDSRDSATYYDLVPNEIYRFEIYFHKLDYLTPYIILNHPQFEPVKVNLKWH